MTADRWFPTYDEPTRRRGVPNRRTHLGVRDPWHSTAEHDRRSGMKDRRRDASVAPVGPPPEVR